MCGALNNLETGTDLDLDVSVWNLARLGRGHIIQWRYTNEVTGEEMIIPGKVESRYWYGKIGPFRLDISREYREMFPLGRTHIIGPQVVSIEGFEPYAPINYLN